MTTYQVEQISFWGDTYRTHHMTQETAFQSMEAMKRKEVEGNNQYTIRAYVNGTMSRIVHRETTPQK